MPDFLAPLQLTPTSAVNPMSFVCIDGIQVDTTGNMIQLCRQATSPNDIPIAVTQTGYNLAPNLIATLTQGTATYAQVAALAGQPLQTFHSGDVCPIMLGVGGATGGAPLGPDTNGNGIMVVPHSGNWYGAIALQSGAQNEIIDVLTHFGKYS